jgi:tetratricopeptide (TPR) repeat protein
MDESIVKHAMESGDAAIAEEAFRRLNVQIESTSDVGEIATLYLGKATLHGVLGQFDDARRQLDLALQYAPDNEDIRLQHDFIGASLYDQERKPGEAYSKLTSVLSDYSERLSRPDVRFMYEDIQLRRGFDATSTGRFNDALPILRECLLFELKPTDKSIVLSDLGRCYSEAEEYESARDCLVQAICIGLTRESEGQAHLYLGIACARLGLFQDAKKEFLLCEERTAEYGLEIGKVYGWLSWICKGLGERSESERYSKLARPC